MIVFVERDIGGSYAVYEYFSLCRLIETAKQLDKCGFARTVITDNRQTFTCFYLDIYVTQDKMVGIRIFEGHIDELDIVPAVGRIFTRNHLTFSARVRRKTLELAIIADIFREQCKSGESTYKARERARECCYGTEKHGERTDSMSPLIARFAQYP